MWNAVGIADADIDTAPRVMLYDIRGLVERHDSGRILDCEPASARGKVQDRRESLEAGFVPIAAPKHFDLS